MRLIVVLSCRLFLQPPRTSILDLQLTSSWFLFLSMTCCGQSGLGFDLRPPASPVHYPWPTLNKTTGRKLSETLERFVGSVRFGLVRFGLFVCLVGLRPSWHSKCFRYLACRLLVVTPLRRPPPPLQLIYSNKLHTKLAQVASWRGPSPMFSSKCGNGGHRRG